MNQYTGIEIRKREITVVNNDPEIKYYAYLYTRQERKEYNSVLPLTEGQKETLEMYLIANPDVLFTGNTRTYVFKHSEEKFVYAEVEED